MDFLIRYPVIHAQPVFRSGAPFRLLSTRTRILAPCQHLKRGVPCRQLSLVTRNGFQSLIDYLPVQQIFKYSSNMASTIILIVEVVGVFPDVDYQQWRDAVVKQRCVGVLC